MNSHSSNLYTHYSQYQDKHFTLEGNECVFTVKKLDQLMPQFFKPFPPHFTYPFRLPHLHQCEVHVVDVA